MSAEKINSLPNIRTGSDNDGNSKKDIGSASDSQLRSDESYGDINIRPSPFNLRWIYGYNADAGVINLNDMESADIFYAALNCGIIYNWCKNQIKILQGHKNIVTCIAADGQGKWVVTADTGPDNILIIWDTEYCLPVRTLLSPFAHMKISKVALSADAKYLLTLIHQQTAIIQWWIWSFGIDAPHATIELVIPDPVVAMLFNPNNSEQFAVMTKYDIWIGAAMTIIVNELGITGKKKDDTYELKMCKPEKYVSDVGKFTSFTFVSRTSQILVATSRGSVLVYGYTIEYNANVDSSDISKMRFIKVLKLENQNITVIKYEDGIVVTGNRCGEIRFYDDQLKLIYWAHDINLSKITNISFNISPRKYEIYDAKCHTPCVCWEKVVHERHPFTGELTQRFMKVKVPFDATIKQKPFVIRDFIICTDHEGIGLIEFVSEKFVSILPYRKANITAMTVHVEKLILSLGYADGVIELMRFDVHRIIASFDLRDHFKVVIPPDDESIRSGYQVIIPQLSVTCLMYSPSGLHLACGLNTGELLFLNPTTLQLLTPTPLKDTKFAIKHICYSSDSLTLAFSDIGKTVCVYGYDCVNYVWNFIGKHRAHYKDITTLFFTTKMNTDGFYKLLSIGQDRVLVEYDIGKSSGECLEFTRLERIEETAVPLTAIEWPIPREIKTHLYDMILIANDEYKYRVSDCQPPNILGTFLGPRYESPVNRLLLVTKIVDEKEQDYLLFATKTVIGLQKMPLDGNPYKHVGILGHPTKINWLHFREDKDLLFTVGKRDTTVCQWAANYKSVEKTTKQGGTKLDPYYCLMDGGKPGWLFKEMRDLFYYIQILCQGTFSPAVRRVGDYILIDSLPDIMRALGYFPSQFEVENLLTDAKYRIYEKEPATDIGFEDFVRLYLNHRPAFGDNLTKIKHAFQNFATFSNDNSIMTRSQFTAMLNHYGECFSNELSYYLLSILSGQTFEDRAAQSYLDYTFLPETITFSDFISNIIGVQDVEKIAEQQSIGSIGSQCTPSSVTVDSTSIK